ncbi:MAG: phosphatase PAP2 family protein [Sporichthyaceae bacterium]
MRRGPAGYVARVRNLLYRPVDERKPGTEPQRSIGARLALGAVVAVLVSVPLVLLLLLVESSWQPLEDLDRSTADSLNSVTRGDGTLVHLLDIAAVALEPWVFRLLVLGVAVWLWRRGAKRLAGWAVVTMAVGGLLGIVLKIIVARARPAFPEPVAHASGYSFPSGHALNSMLGVGVLVLVFLPVLNRTGRLLAYLLGALVVLLTGFDRVALGVHFVSDVLAGWAVALAVLAGTSAAFEIWRREQGRRPSTVAEGVEPEAGPEIGEAHRQPQT